ncbi:MAG: diguanylate cyclase [Gammaproteobacteria bacterium]|nr:diguanylate cyclase [Gammaproteobacteria bacterium]
MAQDSTDQNADSWKQKYYFQLDQLDEKEKEWSKLEAALKKAISRISLAAEGSHHKIDKYLDDVRQMIKDKVNPHHLDLVIDDLSKIIAKVEAEKKSPGQSPAVILQSILQSIQLPDKFEKKKEALLKKIDKVNSEQLDNLLGDTYQLINAAIGSKTDTDDTNKPGLLKRLIGSDDKSADKNHDMAIEAYRDCLLTIIESFMRTEVVTGKLSAFKTLAVNANEKIQLQQLSNDLAGMLSEVNKSVQKTTLVTESDDLIQPSIQELIIRLLEQLLVPNELTSDVNQMKERLEQDNNPADWKILLKDVASLINVIRSRMQEEKQEFEDFLQTITGRLNDIDEFLQIESRSIQLAETQGREFDNKMNNHVEVIRNDVNQATELNALKQVVTSRIDVISDHVKAYRDIEDKRLKDALGNLSDMQSRMNLLEEETENLRKVIAEKNKEALSDVLTEIPNRLAYEKKVIEEIARWKRFGHPLSLVIWDVDFFKKVNDTYGHKAGDKVLKTVAQVLHERIRETDFLARYGGEEFIMLLPGTKEEETLRLVNDLRERVSSCNFTYQGEEVKITISCGVSCFRKEDTGWTKVFERADKALYQAKKSGRNRCVVSSCRSDG